MATYDNAYSRFIAWAKIILPLLALAILSTLFLFSRGIDTGQAIPYADVDIKELAREPRITLPNYAGVTADGAAISVIAQSARPDPDNPQQVNAADLFTAIDTPEGLRLEITSGSGTLNGQSRQANLSGGVVVQTSSGYNMRTAQLTTSLDGALLTADSEITADGPLGSLIAGQMLLKRAESGAGSYLLVFKGGVKLIYTP
ncbi:MAG: LPS export ABC transporter periplasmic protein LptC [Halocynthiibacter sp.]